MPRHSRARYGTSSLLLPQGRASTTALKHPVATVPPKLAHCSECPGQTWAMVTDGGCRLMLTLPAGPQLNLCTAPHSIAAHPCSVPVPPDIHPSETRWLKQGGVWQLQCNSLRPVPADLMFHWAVQGPTTGSPHVIFPE